MKKSKEQNKPQIQSLNIRNIKFCHLTFMLYAYFGFCALSFVISNNAYALNLDKMKAYFISGDYKAAITEGEKVMAKTSSNSIGLDELYYILGLSYLKDGNYLRASDIFEIIIKEFKDTQFLEEAKVGLGDAYFLKGDYEKAGKEYKELLDQKKGLKLKPALYHRLSQCAAKTGDTQRAKDYLDKLKQEFPLNYESLGQEAEPIADNSFYYSVQVGAFSSNINANNLVNELIRKDYPAFIEEARSESGLVYKVRVGKIHLRQEAVELEKKLSGEGYSTKIFP